MKAGSKLVWKLTSVGAIVLTVAITVSGYVSNLICAHYSLQSARAFLTFNSESIIHGIGQLMMSRNNQGIEELIGEISGDSEVYGDIRMVSHHSGEVVASRSGENGKEIQLEEWACAVCHQQDDLGGAEPGILDRVVNLPKGNRALEVMAPILNEPSCRNAACHAHADDPPVLGFLNADYSLGRLDAQANARRGFLTVTVLASLVLGIVASRIVFMRLLDRPISGLIAGTKRIAANELGFRFEQKRDDEIGLLEESFNTMTARIQAHRDELRSALEYLGGIVDNSADIIITVTPGGFIETFNSGAEQALGYSRVEVIGRPMESLFADPRERDVAINQLKDTDNVKNYKTRFLAKDGQVRHVLLTLSRLRDREGNPIGTFGISKDITQEKQLQDQLRDTKEYLEGMFENSAAIIITVNPDGAVETFNRGAEEALGYRRKEVIGRPIEDLYVDPEERRAAAILLDEHGNVKNFETRLRAKNGEVRRVLLTLSRLRDGLGRSIGTIGISKDITQQTKLQDELRDAKQYLEGMVENSADIIITVNSAGLIETFNRGGEDALGYRREEVIGRPIEELYVEAEERHAAAAILEKTGNVNNYETRLRTKDGGFRNVLLTLSRLRDAQGRSIGTIGISKDITHETKLQDELRDAKQYLEGMVENSADIIITVNSAGLIETFNRGGEDALGYSREEVIGRPIEELYVEPEERHAAAALLKETGNVKNYEIRLRTKDGEIRNVLMTLSPHRDAQGRAIGTIGISKDITHEKKLQRELIHSQQFAAMGQAVTRIQHAIKNMLNSLKGGAYLVKLGISKNNPERVDEGWVMVEEGIERIAGLSKNMLSFAREWRPELQRVDLSGLLVKICESNRQSAAERGVALRHEISDGLPQVLCDPKQIHTATTDLVVNAIDACLWKDYGDDESPEVVLRNSMAEDGNGFVIEVSDNGCGMTEDVRENIFTPFFSTKETLGTGLGLAVTAKIIRVHAGKISVDSEPDRGTSFRIQIPIDGPKE